MKNVSIFATVFALSLSFQFCFTTSALACGTELFVDICDDTCMVAYYPLNGNGYECGAYGYHGTVYGASPAVDRTGWPSGACYFDGVDDYIEVPAHSAFNLTSWTIVAWIKADGLPDDVTGTIAGKTGGTYNYTMQFDADSLVLSQYESTAGGGDHAVGGKLELNKWYFVAGTRDATTGRHVLYRYLAESYPPTLVGVDTIVSSDPPYAASSPFYIGGCTLASVPRYFRGTIDDLVLYNRALTASQIDSLANLNYCPVPIVINSFVAMASGSTVDLAWNIMADEEITGFKIYRRTVGAHNSVCINEHGLITPESRRHTDNDVHTGRSYQYTLGVVDESGSEIRSQMVMVHMGDSSIELHQNYPNPFNPNTTISFTMPERGHASLQVFNPEGKLVRVLANEVLSEGRQEVHWDGKNSLGNPVNSGVYFYRLTVEKETISRKMLLLK